MKFNTASRFNVPLGHWFGVPAALHWSSVLIFLILVWFDLTIAISFAAIFFVVLLHECGHCLAGRRFGCPAREIILYPFGGAAYMTIPSLPKHELIVALAGPLVNLILVPVLWPLARFHTVLWYLALANVAMLVFNLIPAFPMDGGRVLRALLSWHTGDRLRATEIAVVTAKVFCGLFVLAGLVLLNPVLFIIAFTIYRSAEEELQYLREQSAYDDFWPQKSDDVRESLRAISEFRDKMSRSRRGDGHED